MNLNARKESPLIFTHFGKNYYLPYTLHQAKRSNPQKRCILIGDEDNKRLAIESDWEYEAMNAIKSEKRDLFNARFRWIQGSRHNPIKGRKDWLRYVFERFFVIEEFLKKEDIVDYWHFDSDTMILTELKTHEKRLRDTYIDCTTLCNDTCPSGFLKTSFTTKFTNSILSNFKDEELLKKQQKEFDNLSSENAFTEMRAFVIHRNKHDIKTLPLSSAFSDQNIWFDDCICQEDGFETVWGDKIKRKIKCLYWSKGKVWARQIEKNIVFEFATVNCSWTSESVFQWIAGYQQGELTSVKRTIRDHLKFNKLEKINDIINKAKKKIYRLIFGMTTDQR